MKNKFDFSYVKEKFKDKEKILTIISLGVGVQSSTMALMAAKGELPMPDYAIFADTGYEPKQCYQYLNFLKKTLPFPILIVEKGNIKDDMINSVDNGTRFPTAPFFTKSAETGKKGMLMRQCTNDYKIQPIRKKIRELCGVLKGKHFPKTKYVEQWIGISTDEIIRAKEARDKYIYNYHPLIEKRMSRQDCLTWIRKNNYPLPAKSACLCCPFHDDNHWVEMKKNTPDEFQDAVEFDKKIRHGSRKIQDQLFLHRSCVPLDEVEFKPKDKDAQYKFGFANECEGMCGL